MLDIITIDLSPSVSINRSIEIEKILKEQLLKIKELVPEIDIDSIGIYDSSWVIDGG